MAHDMHRHGAQLGSLALIKTIDELGVPVETVALGGGALETEFRRVAPLSVLDIQDCQNGTGANLARDLYRRGFRLALVNSLAGGWLGSDLTSAGLSVVTMVHELPSVIAENGLQPLASQITDWSQAVIFASEEVRDRFPGSLDSTGARVHVLPQGLYRRELLSQGALEFGKGSRAGIHTFVGVGFGDWRKGFDIFVRVAELASREYPKFEFRWVGDVDRHDDRLSAAVELAESLGNVEVLGFREDVAALLLDGSALLLPSREDPFPSVVLEAAAMGLGAVVVAGCTGMEKAVADLRGVVSANDDPTSLLGAIRDLVALDLEAPEVAKARIDVVRWRYSHRAYAGALLALGGISPTVSVAVPSYRHATYLPDRLASLLHQTAPLHEILVSDDASGDGSVEIAAEALKGFEGAWMVRENDVNSGNVFRHWISCVRDLSSDYVWIAESDDTADEDFVRAMLEAMRRDGSSMAFCSARPMAPDGSPTATDYGFYLERFIPNIDWSSDHHWSGTEFITDVAGVLNPILTVSSVLFRRQALLDALTRLESRVHEYPTCGDWVVYCEVALNGSISYVSRTLVSHRRHGESVISSADRSAHLGEIEAVQEWIGLLSGGAVEALAERRRSYLHAMRG